MSLESVCRSLENCSAPTEEASRIEFNQILALLYFNKRTAVDPEVREFLPPTLAWKRPPFRRFSKFPLVGYFRWTGWSRLKRETQFDVYRCWSNGKSCSIRGAEKTLGISLISFPARSCKKNTHMHTAKTSCVFAHGSISDWADNKHSFLPTNLDTNLWTPATDESLRQLERQRDGVFAK